MNISIFSIGKIDELSGFAILEIAGGSEGRDRSLFGIMYDNEEKILYVDIFWVIFEIDFN